MIRKGRLQPGRIFLADTSGRPDLEDEEVKAELAAEHPYEDWLHAGLLHLDGLAIESVQDLARTARWSRSRRARPPPT